MQYLFLAGLPIQPRGDASGGSECLIAYPTYTIYHINMISEIRAILLSFVILSLKTCLMIIEFDYSNIILIVKSIESNAIASLRSDYNINRLISFHVEDGISSVLEYDDLKSRKYTLYILYSSKF